MTEDDRQEVERAKKLLEEAQTGMSSKSKNTLIREALQALSKIK